MGTDVTDASLDRCFSQRLPHSRVGDGQTSDLYRAGKHPVVAGAEPSRLLPRIEHIQHPVVDVHGTLRLWRLHVIDYLMHDATFYVQRTVQPIDIRPAQSQALADTQTEAHTDQRDSVEWLFQLLGKLPELFHGEATRLAYAFRGPFDRDQCRWIPLHGHVAAPHGEVPQNADKTTDVNLALGSEVERLQPQV